MPFPPLLICRASSQTILTGESFYVNGMTTYLQTNYIFSLFYPIAYMGCKLWFKDSIISLTNIDFTTELGIMEQEQVNADLGISEESNISASKYDKWLNRFF